jgi:hypothetical protein
MSKRYVSIRALPAEGHTYRWGGGRPWTKEPVVLEVIDTEIPVVRMKDPAVFDPVTEVQEKLANIRARAEFLKAIPQHQIHISQLDEMREDPQLVIVDNVPAPPPPPKTELDEAKERLAALEKQLAARGGKSAA